MPIKDNLSKGTNCSDATAVASEILEGKSAYTSEGKIEGTMTDNNAVDITLDTAVTSYIVPNGYHNGSGKVQVSTQNKIATPSTNVQIINADPGKVLSSVSIEAINTQSKSAIPTDSLQTINPDNGYYLSSVNIGAVTSSGGIGKELYDSGYSSGNVAGYNSGYAAAQVGTAVAANVLSGKTFTNASGVGISGSMSDRGAWTQSVTP